MAIHGVITQVRTTDLEASIRFYTEELGLGLAFRYSDFYAGVQAGGQVLHLKLVDDPDPSVAGVASGGHFHLYLASDDVDGDAAGLQRYMVQAPHDTAWGTREFIIRDNQGHTIYVGGPRHPPSL